MSEKMTPAKATALRKPFAPESIGKLPKGGVMLDYVGHAAVVDRLLTVDPEWSWEPFAVGPDGLPAIDRNGNLWIRMTVCGVTRIGVGDGKNVKELISDALRNAAMRFGVALDLWAKENLVEFKQAAQAAAAKPSDQPEFPPAETKPKPEGSYVKPAAVRAADRAEPAPESPLLDTNSKLAKRMFALMGDAGITDRDKRLAFVAETVGRDINGSKAMTDADAKAVIKRLESMLDQPFDEGADQ